MSAKKYIKLLITYVPSAFQVTPIQLIIDNQDLLFDIRSHRLNNNYRIVCLKFSWSDLCWKNSKHQTLSYFFIVGFQFVLVFALQILENSWVKNDGILKLFKVLFMTNFRQGYIFSVNMFLELSHFTTPIWTSKLPKLYFVLLSLSSGWRKINEKDILR